MFTNPGTPWLGKMVFCLGSGPSLSKIPIEELFLLGQEQKYNNAIIFAINSSIKFSRENQIEPDALFFTDEDWFESNEKLVREFGGLKFTVSRRAKEKYPDLMRIENITRNGFSVGSPPMRDGRSSGHRAVSLSVMLGAKYIILLGYDMKIDKITNRSHYHDEYNNTESERSYKEEFVPGFRGWHFDALKVGCQILNATEDSAVEEFPKINLKEVLFRTEKIYG